MIIITGTSSGIGKALTSHYLTNGETVIGIGRTNRFNHSNYTHISCDLSNPQALIDLDLSNYIHQHNESITLINNAGTIGEIKRSMDLTAAHYLSVATLNIVAVQSLCAHVLKTAGHANVVAIVNISSGAAKRPIPAWSAYCASKAAVDLFSETLSQELQELGASTKIYSVAPGVVDTEMQVTIRSSNSDDFSGRQKFVDLKEQEELRSPEEVVALLMQLLEKKEQEEVVCRL